jgi:oligopeptide/dipeptide ABC transporter ATP-binding protein
LSRRVDWPCLAVFVPPAPGWQILDLLRELVAERGIAMLFVTHDLGVVAQLYDDVSVIYAGQTVETGPTATVLAAPLHPYTRALLAAAPTLTPSPRIAAAIQGEPPDASRLPAGCAFADRCPHVQPPCRVQTQTLQETGDGHAVACWRWAEITRPRALPLDPAKGQSPF